MASITISTITSIVRDNLNEQSTVILSDTEISNIIKDGYKDALAKLLCYEVSEALTLVDGQKIYPIPATYQVPFRVTYVESNSKGLMEILPQIVGHLNPTDITSGKGIPLYWFQWGKNIIFEPTPNSTAAGYTTNIYRACFPDSAPTTVLTNLPAELDDCVADFATAYANFKLKRWGDAGLAYNRYIAGIQKRKFDYIIRPADPRTARQLPYQIVQEIQQ